MHHRNSSNVAFPLKITSLFTAILLFAGCGEDLRSKVGQLERQLNQEKAAVAVAKSELELERAKNNKLSTDISETRSASEALLAKRDVTVAELTARIAQLERAQEESNRKDSTVKAQWNAAIKLIKSECEGLARNTYGPAFLEGKSAKDLASERTREHVKRKKNCMRIVFDLQSTGIDNTQKIAAVVNRMFSELGYVVSYAELADGYHINDRVKSDEMKTQKEEHLREFLHIYYKNLPSLEIN